MGTDDILNAIEVSILDALSTNGEIGLTEQLGMDGKQMDMVSDELSYVIVAAAATDTTSDTLIAIVYTIIFRFMGSRWPLCT